VVWKQAGGLGPLKDHNRLMVDQARLWLVATTDDQLVALHERFAVPVPDEAAQA
jgi:hypothetical protein